VEHKPKDMAVRQIMTTEIDSILETDTLAVAAKRLAYSDIGALPVCDSQKHLRGMITDRDIVVKGVAKGKDPATTTVGEIETGSPVSVTPDTTLDETVSLMAEHRIRRVPVVVNDQLVGMISQADVVRTGDTELTNHVMRGVSE
jgi:CBS domain-containing protein